MCSNRIESNVNQCIKNSVHKSSLFDFPRPLLKLADGGNLWGSVAGEQPAEDADAATEEQEANSQQEQGLTGDQSGDLGDFGNNSSADSGQISDKSLHSSFLH